MHFRRKSIEKLSPNFRKDCLWQGLRWFCFTLPATNGVVFSVINNLHG
jgi:hypothetical protein